MKALRVCIVTTAHPFDDVRVYSKFAETFRLRGYEVFWVGPRRSFFDHTVPSKTGIDFILYGHSEGKLARLAGPLRLLLAARRMKDIDVYYAPEPDSARIALWLAKRRHAKVIFDIHEVYHGAMLTRWIPPALRGLVSPRMIAGIRKICARSDVVLCVNKPILNFYADGKADAFVVRNCAPSFFLPKPAGDPAKSSQEELRVMHGKGIPGRGTEIVLEALRLLGSDMRQIKIVMINKQGSGDETTRDWLENRISELGVKESVEVRPGVPMKEMPALLQSCEVGLIAYNKEFGSESLPNRFFEYMAAGLCIVAPAYATEMSEIIHKEGCGVLVDFENPIELAEALRRLRADPQGRRAMGERAAAAFRNYSWEHEITPVLERMEEIMRLPGNDKTTKSD